MKLHNQESHALRWTMGGREWECEAFGMVDIPDALVPFARRRGLPLKPSPVAQEARAARKAALAKEEAEGSELLQLRQRAELAEAAKDTAEKKLEEVQAEATKDRKRADGFAEKLKAGAERERDLIAEKKALEAQIVDLAAKVAELEQALGRSPSAADGAGESEAPDGDKEAQAKPKGGSRRK